MTDQHLAHALALTIPVLCWLARPDGEIQWYNQAWYDYTGQVRADADGRGWLSVHDPEVLPKVLVRWNLNLERREPFRMVARLKGADSVFRPFVTRVRPTLRDGHLLSWFGSNVEISDLLDEDDDLRAELESLGGGG